MSFELTNLLEPSLIKLKGENCQSYVYINCRFVVRRRRGWCRGRSPPCPTIEVSQGSGAPTYRPTFMT